MSTKKDLQKLIEGVKTKQFREGEAKGLVSSIGDELKAQFAPVIEGISKDMGKAAKEAVAAALKDIKIDTPSIEMPQIDIDTSGIESAIADAISNIQISVPEIKIPESKAPIVNLHEREFSIPDRFYAQTELSEIGPKQPLAVRLFDSEGKPFQFPIYTGGSGGGKTDFFTIKGFEQSAFAEITNPDGRLKVELPSGTSGLTDTELRASAVPVSQVSGVGWSIFATGAGASFFAEIANPDGRVKVELPTSGLTDTELRASHLDVQQMSGSIDSVYVTGIANSSFSELQNGDGRLRVSVETGGSGLTDAELRASHLDVQQLSGTIDSVYVTGVVTSFFAEISNPDGRVKVELPTGSSGLTDTELRASHLDVQQVSGSSDSTNLVGINGTAPAAGLNETNAGVLRTVLMTDSVSSVYVNNPVNQGDAATALRVVVAGNSDLSTVVNSGTLTGITNTITTNQLSGAVDSVVVNSGTITTVTTVGSITNSLAAAVVDSGGVQYSGTNPFPVDIINIGDVAISTGNGTVGTGVQRMVIASNTTTAVVGTVASDVADDGAPPVKNGGVARTANPTAVAAGDAVTYGADDLGRQVVRLNQVRDLIQTAYVSVTNGTETTLRSAVAGAYLDLVMITASNNSDAAVSVDIRPVTAGNIVNTLRIPANGTAGWAPTIAWPQTDTGNNWTVDGPDETGRTLTFSALFSQEI